MAAAKGSRRRAKPPLEHSILYTATLCLLAAGAVMVYSASSAESLTQNGDPAFFLKRYVVFGAIAAIAVMTKTEVLLIILGGIFVIEALSVLIQVFSFQTFRKRVFLMAPIHHHFELQAWSETKIILRFWIVAAVCSAIGFTLYQQSLTG